MKREKGKPGRPSWPKEQEQFLRDHAGRLTGRQIGALLGRTHSATQEKASKLGISLVITDRIEGPLYPPPAKHEGSKVPRKPTARDLYVERMVELAFRTARRAA